MQLLLVQRHKNRQTDIASAALSLWELINAHWYSWMIYHPKTTLIIAFPTAGTRAANIADDVHGVLDSGQSNG